MFVNWAESDKSVFSRCPYVTKDARRMIRAGFLRSLRKPGFFKMTPQIASGCRRNMAELLFKLRGSYLTSNVILFFNNTIDTTMTLPMIGTLYMYMDFALVWFELGLTSHQHRKVIWRRGPRFKVSSDWLVERGNRTSDPWIYIYMDIYGLKLP